TIATTISVRFTIPITIPISNSSDLNGRSSFRVRLNAEDAEQFSISIRIGATETIQPTSAHKVKKPRERKMSQMENPIRSGSLPGGKCVLAAKATERNQPQQMAPKRISQTVWSAIIAVGRKRTPG